MNFQQLRILREALRHNFNLTEVANALYTAQSGVSKHINLKRAATPCLE